MHIDTDFFFFFLNVQERMKPVNMVAYIFLHDLKWAKC